MEVLLHTAPQNKGTHCEEVEHKKLVQDYASTLMPELQQTIDNSELTFTKGKKVFKFRHEPRAKVQQAQAS